MLLLMIQNSAACACIGLGHQKQREEEEGELKFQKQPASYPRCSLILSQHLVSYVVRTLNEEPCEDQIIKLQCLKYWEHVDM